VGLVLTVTPIASEAIRQLVESAGPPQPAGIRIATGEPTEQGTPISLALVEGPEPGDEVVVEDDASVFLEPTVSEVLDHTVLDAELSDGNVSFALRDNHTAGGESANGSAPH